MGYKGVKKDGKKWSAHLDHHQWGKIYLGSFETEELAAKAYNVGFVKYYGGWTGLNLVSQDVPEPEIYCDLLKDYKRRIPCGCDMDGCLYPMDFYAEKELLKKVRNPQCNLI
jgi:hypothetical protein